MKRVFKKNQLIVTALALMIAAAGFLNYTYEANEHDMATIAEKGKDEVAAIKKEKKKVTAAVESKTGDDSAGETVLTDSDSVAISKAATLKMDREQTRAAGKASLLEIVNNKDLTEKERQSAVDELAKMTDIAEREAACELLLQSKGFEEAIVSISGDGADVIVNKKEVTDAERAQIEDVIARKGGIDAAHIVISAMN